MPRVPSGRLQRGGAGERPRVLHAHACRVHVQPRVEAGSLRKDTMAQISGGEIDPRTRVFQRPRRNDRRLHRAGQSIHGSRRHRHACRLHEREHTRDVVHAKAGSAAERRSEPVGPIQQATRHRPLEAGLRARRPNRMPQRPASPIELQIRTSGQSQAVAARRARDGLECTRRRRAHARHQLRVALACIQFESCGSGGNGTRSRGKGLAERSCEIVDAEIGPSQGKMARRRGATCRGVAQFNRSIGVNLAGGGVEVEAVDQNTGSAEGSATRERDVAERRIGDVPAGEREPHRRCGQRTRHLRRAFEPAGETARIRARETGSLTEIDRCAGVQGDRRPFAEDVGPSGNHYAALLSSGRPGLRSGRACRRTPAVRQSCPTRRSRQP